MNLNDLVNLNDKRFSRGQTLVAQRAVFGNGKLATAQQVSDIMYEARLDFQRGLMDEVQANKPIHVQRDEAYELQEEILAWNLKREQKALAEMIAMNNGEPAE